MSNANAPGATFWAWFQENAASYKRFIADRDRDMNMYQRLIAEMAKVDKRISPELTIEEGKGVLVLTCNGMREAASALIAFADEAPEIPGWRVQKFRPPGGEDMAIEMAGLSLAPKEMKVAYALDKERSLVHLALVIPGYKDTTEFKQIAFLLLDHSIGEYNTMMHVGGIEFGAPEHAPRNARLISLEDLRKLIEREFY